MKPFFVAAVTTLALGVSFCGPSQQANVKQAPGVGVAPWIIGVEAGDYSYFQYNKTQLQQDFLAQIFNNQEADFQYYRESVEAIEKEFRIFLQSIFAENGLKWMSDNAFLSATGSGPDADPDGIFVPGTTFVKGEKLAAAVNAYTKDKLALTTTIASFTSVSAGSLPSFKTDDVDGAEIPELPARAQIEFDKIKKWYDDKLAEIDTVVINLGHKVKVQDAEQIIAPNSGKGLTVPLPSYLLTAEEIAKLQKDIKFARTWGRNQVKDLEKFGLYTRQLVQNFVDLYGRTNKFRFNHPSEVDGGENFMSDFETIEKAFFARTYFRYTYGMPMGTFMTRYDKKILNLDIFVARTVSFDQFAEELVFGDKDLQTADHNMRFILRRVDARAEKILDGNLNFIETIENLSTYLSGNRVVAKAMQRVLRLIARDIAEEKMISAPAGLEKISGSFRAQYASSKETLLAYLPIMAELDWNSLSEGLQNAATAQGFTPGAGVGQGTLAGTYLDLALMGQIKFQELEQAAVKEDTIRAAMNNNRFRAQQRKRNSGLEDLLNN